MIATGIRSWTKYMTAGHEVTGQDAWRQDMRSRARITDNGNKIPSETQDGRTLGNRSGCKAAGRKVSGQEN